MALIRINWRQADSVAPDAAMTGESGVAEQGNAVRAEKPMMVYITDNDPTGKQTRKLEDVVFANEQLGIGCKFFDTIKMSPEKADQDRILKDAGRRTPRIVFLKRDYKVHAVMQNKQLTAGKLLKSMKLLAKQEYVNSFDQMVREYGKLLNERDRLEGKKTQLSDARARLQKKPNASKAKKLARDEAAWQKDMDAWAQKEKELLTFRNKGEPKA
ncbi:MAG: hypothetical protein ACYTGV_00015 [Planctomycetota bacterium]|jgi:hypothetical protein